MVGKKREEYFQIIYISKERGFITVSTRISCLHCYDCENRGASHRLLLHNLGFTLFRINKAVHSLHLVFHIRNTQPHNIEIDIDNAFWLQ